MDAFKDDPATGLNGVPWHLLLDEDRPAAIEKARVYQFP